YLVQCVLQKNVGGFLDYRRDLLPGRAAARRVVFESAVPRRIVRRSDHDSVRKSGAPAKIVGEDGMGNDRGWRVIASFRANRRGPVGREYLKGAHKRGFR